MKLGTVNSLVVKELGGKGAVLDAGPLGSAFLPKKMVRHEWHVGDNVDVFLYHDAEDRLTATTKKPLARVGEFSLLRVAQVNVYGAFLNWGLPQDLFVPFKEQDEKMEVDKSYPVFLYESNDQRIVASSRLNRFIQDEAGDYNVGEAVELFVVKQTELGYKVIVNKQHWGILYSNEVFRPLWPGLKIDGFVKLVREDHRLDVSLYKPNHEKLDDAVHVIFEKLKAAGGSMALTDKSEPAKIYTAFGVSKKSFKSAIGILYKQRKILIEDTGISLLPDEREDD